MSGAQNPEIGGQPTSQMPSWAVEHMLATVEDGDPFTGAAAAPPSDPVPIDKELTAWDLTIVADAPLSLHDVNLEPGTQPQQAPTDTEDFNTLQILTDIVASAGDTAFAKQLEAFSPDLSTWLAGNLARKLGGIAPLIFDSAANGGVLLRGNLGQWPDDTWPNGAMTANLRPHKEGGFHLQPTYVIPKTTVSR
jgi:hypothetical protein